MMMIYMKVCHLYGLSPLWVRRCVLRVEGLAYPLPQILHTFFPSEEESGEEGEEKPGDTAPAPAPMLPRGSNTSWGTVSDSHGHDVMV